MTLTLSWLKTVSFSCAIQEATGTYQIIFFEISLSIIKNFTLKATLLLSALLCDFHAGKGLGGNSINLCCLFSKLFL